jgi:hypothetical protein
MLAVVMKQFIGLVVRTGLRLTTVFYVSLDCETVFDRASACTNTMYLSLKSRCFYEVGHTYAA